MLKQDVIIDSIPAVIYGEKSNMADIYIRVPTFENSNFMLRQVNKMDAYDLLKVYSDTKAVPIFNSDNCNGDTFYYDTLSKINKALDFWDFSYRKRYFVRWSIIEKINNTVIGTIELFHRDSSDFFNNCGLLRLDVRGDYEKTESIVDILRLIIPKAYELFDCDMIATKAISSAEERIAALKAIGFDFSSEKLIGHDGTEYGSYFIKLKG